MKARSVPLPDAALLGRYSPDTGSDCVGNYVDCFRAEFDGAVDLQSFVAAFYRTPLFRLERVILARAMKLASTDEGAIALSEGRTQAFAAWSVEARTADQLLMCAVDRRTRSWFMVRPSSNGTVLYFGSAVLPPPDGQSDRPFANWLYRAALPLHRVYSVLLLGAAHRKLARDRSDKRAQ
ncbi:MAG: hypothetical protein AAFX10_13140 [Pseudomonadota bacterium]